MGKKSKEERAEKREKYSDKMTREKLRFKLIAGGVIAGVIIVLAFTGYTFYQNTFAGKQNAPGAPPGAGKLGDEHEHAAMNVIIHSDKFDFTSPAYQVKSPYIHFESGNGETVHRHASNVTMGYLFDTLKIKLTDDCYVFPDSRQFCTNSDYSLKFFVNHEQVPSIRNYVLHQGDR